ncbi:MAG: hypothetical protein ACKV2T_37595 [Kofleriaceae bacterium]
MNRILLVSVCLMTYLARPASADTASRIADFAENAADKLDRWGLDSKVAEALARAAIGRTRRAIAIGPHVGGVAQIDAKDSVNGGGISFGLGLYTFKVPTGLALKEVIKERVKKELQTAIATGTAPDGDAFIRGIIEKVIRDVLDGAYGSQKFPKPLVTVLIEGQKSFGDADGFQLRAMFGYGLFSKLSVGLSLAGSFPAADGAKNDFVVGPEFSFRVTPIGKHRTPVFDVFARFDLGVREPQPVAASLGMRLLLDVL